MHIYYELLEIVEIQKKALSEEKFEEAIVLQKKRQEIIDKIKDGVSKIALDQQIDKEIIEKILNTDRELQSLIYSKLSSISNKLENIQKLRCFRRNISSYKTKMRLNIAV